jgi:hypothetical protein
VLLFGALLLLLPGSAAAFGPLSSFGEFGSGAGQLNSPAQLSVAAKGDLYVADSGNDRISVFAGDGSFLRTFGQGLLQEPEDVALDDEGRAYVADSGNHRIAVFSAAGFFLFAFGESGEGALTDPVGVDVDASMFGATVFVADSGNNLVVSFTPAGDFLDSFGSVAAPHDVIVGGGGNLFVANFGNEQVDVFDKDGSGPIRSIGAGGVGELSGPVALVADGLGGIYVADRTAQRVVHFRDSGEFLGSVDAVPNVGGVGVACQGNVFATETGTLLARVVRFGEAGTPPPPCTSPSVEPVQVSLAPPPSNRIRFGGLIRNRRNGSAVLFVRVPGPGRVILKGRGVRRLTRSAPRAMRVRLPVKPKVRLRHFLKKHGKGRIRVEVTFRPVGGEPRSIEKPILLKRRRR